MNGVGRIGAFGLGATVTNVVSATDPGEIYQVDKTGLLVLSATPAPPNASSSGFYYQNSHGTGQLPSGTFAFRSPGSVVTSLLSNVASGDSIELPGSFVSSVAYGASSITVVTSAGTTTFSNVTYLAGATPTTFTAAADPITGLQQITFTSTTPTTFQQVTNAGTGEYAWSSAANWTNGIPGNGGDGGLERLVQQQPEWLRRPPSNLSLDTLTVTNGFLAVAGSLTVGNASTLARQRQRLQRHRSR